MAIERADKRLLTVAEVAALLSVHPITERRLIKAGKLPVVRIGRAVRVRATDLDSFEKSRSRSSSDALARWRLTPEESAERLKLMHETFARRDRRGNIGISTLELVRASRRELEERDERRTRPGS